jgi:hypothetical protein
MDGWMDGRLTGKSGSLPQTVTRQRILVNIGISQVIACCFLCGPVLKHNLTDE